MTFPEMVAPDRSAPGFRRPASGFWPNIETPVSTTIWKSSASACGPWDVVLLHRRPRTERGPKRSTRTSTSRWTDSANQLVKLGSDPVLLSVPGNHDLMRPDPTGFERHRPSLLDQGNQATARFLVGTYPLLSGDNRQCLRQLLALAHDPPVPEISRDDLRPASGRLRRNGGKGRACAWAWSG